MFSVFWQALCTCFGVSAFALPRKHMTEPKRPQSRIAGILGRARVTTKALDQQQGVAATRLCANCQAARPADADIRVCDYCGFRFMSEDVGSG